MPNAMKTIKVEIKVKDNKKVPVTKAVEVLNHIQDIVFNVGDHLRGNEPRSGGDFPTSVKKDCNLVFKNIKSGSLIAELQIEDEQVCLPDMKTYGERALESTNEIIETINKDDQPQTRLPKIINNPYRLNRILNKLDPIWPEESSDYKLSFSFNNLQKEFIPARKAIIKAMLHPEKVKTKEIIQGRIIDFRVDQHRKILIDTSTGQKTVKYPPEMENYILDHVGHIVKITGDAVKEGKRTLEYNLQNESDLTKKQSLDVSIIKMKDRIIEFKEPIQAYTKYENEQYLISNEKLNLLSVSKHIKDGLKEINEELNTIWKEYALADDSELTEDAKKFKRYLLSIVKGGT